MADPTPKARWYRLTPDRLIAGLLAVEGLLWLSDRLGSPEWHKGYAVLIAVAVVGFTFLLMLLWFLASLLFRWRFQFSIRSLLVLTVAVAVPCSWLAVEMKAARKQKEAVEAIQAQSVCWVFHQGIPPLDPEPSEPAWLRTLLGREFFVKVIGVHWLGVGDTDAGLEHLEGLSQLEWLSLDYAHVTDAGLEHIRGLTQLTALSLANPHVTNAGLEHLKDLTRLRELDLTHTQVTDGGLECLKGLSQLQELRLGGTRVTDQGVKELRRSLPNCKIIFTPRLQGMYDQPWN